MSKGYKPNDGNRPDVITIDTNPDEIIDVIEKCWQFPLEQLTSFTLTISIGLPVIGSIHENKVLVRGHSQALGFVPKDVASEIIQVTLEKRAKLVGKVLSISESSNPSNTKDVWIELCLK